jgi:hypothetical protein
MSENQISIEDLVEIELFEQDDFLKIKETLTRIGVSSRKEKKLFQSCHILHKRGKYYIVHFKELFALDGLHSNMDDNDVARRNTIANLLEDWELLEIVDPEQTEEPVASIAQIKIISYKEKEDWELCPKYHIGNRKRRPD